MSSQTARFEKLLEAVPEAMAGMDGSGAIRFVNREAELLFDYDRIDLVGRSIEMLVPNSLRQVHTVFGKSYVSGNSGKSSVAVPVGRVAAARELRPMGRDTELSGRQRDGTRFPVDLSLSDLDTGDGMMVVAVMRDLSDARNADENRREADRMAAIVQYCGEAILSTTIDGTITSWNPAAETMYGYTSEEIVGRSIKLLRPDDRDTESDAWLAKITQGQATKLRETVRLRKDGTAIPVMLTVSPIHGSDGTIVGASLISSDMTQQQQALASARAMIESSLDSLVSISPEGRITDVNEATVTVTGIPRQVLIGTAFSDYFTEPKKANAIYQRVFAEGMAVDYPLTMRHRDGTLTEVLYNASVYRDGDGSVLGVFAAARDVTKQSQAQREIASQQAKELGRLAELERFQRLTVGRELKMIELKKEIEHLRMPGIEKGTSGDEP